jgi:predicted RNA binding protein YcfA (HicA-like mRNA interferase family)
LPALRGVSGEEAKRVFEREGWFLRTTTTAKGSHLWILKRDGHANHLSVPAKRELGIGLLLKLIKAAGMTRERFEELLRQ